MNRVVKGIACYEEPLMWRVAGKLYLHVHPDVASLLTIVSGVVANVLYVNASANPFNYLWANVPLIVHWICDGIDGKIAKLRKLNRGRKGWLIDKVSDFTSSILFISGFFYSVSKNVMVMLVFVACYIIIFSVYIYNNINNKRDVIFGGTESRLVLSVLNVVMWVRRIFY